jgi:hypothetical protein
MGVAALISWLVTAFFGLYLLAVWLIEYDVTGEGAPASRLPTPVILGHVLFALTGVVFSVIHLLSHASTQGWTAVAILAVTAALGLTMFTRWIPVHRGVRGGRIGPGVPVGGLRLPGRTGVSGVCRYGPRRARRRHRHPGAAHHAQRLIGHSRGRRRAGVVPAAAGARDVRDHGRVLRH